MNCEFMIASTPLPPSMPLPKAMLRLPVSNAAKVNQTKYRGIIIEGRTIDVSSLGTGLLAGETS